jgi:hypothetical protein
MYVGWAAKSAVHPIATEHIATQQTTLCAISGLMHRSKQHLYSITSSALVCIVGVSAAVAERLFAAVAPAVAAIERERGGVEHDLLFALIAVQADIYRRRASS